MKNGEPKPTGDYGLVDILVLNGGGKSLRRLVLTYRDHMVYQNFRMLVQAQGSQGDREFLEGYEWDKWVPIYRDSNSFPPRGVNDLLEYSATMLQPQSEYIFILDDDFEIMLPGMLLQLLLFYNAGSWDMVATEHCFFQGSKDIGEDRRIRECGMGAMLFRRDVFEKLGYLDEHTFVFHGSDSDYCYRARCENFKLGLVPNTRPYMKHYNQTGTRLRFIKDPGGWQPIIDKDQEVLKARLSTSPEEIRAMHPLKRPVYIWQTPR